MLAEMAVATGVITAERLGLRPVSAARLGGVVLAGLTVVAIASS